jgi:hypothetical protein
MMYGQDNRGHITGTQGYYSDNLNWLYRDYVKNLRSFICPGTENIINPTNTVAATYPVPGLQDLRDLQVFAVSRKRYPGHSYENFSWWKNPPHASEYTASDPYGRSGTEKTESRVSVYSHRQVCAFGLGGTVAGPSRIWLQVDADDLFSTFPGAINDYPDPGDNHGGDGHNANFADGHAEWVPVKGNRYLMARELSMDENKSKP